MSSKRRSIFLALILVVTAGLWSGVSGIKLNADDYQYLPTLAPIQTLGDIFRPFVTPDANPSFFRPVANMTMSLDFLLFHWNGPGFHLTNLFFHLITTLLVFFVARNIFRLSEKTSMWTMFIFGFAASHEYNLVVDTARADTLAALFALCCLLFQKKAKERQSIVLALLAWLSFGLSLLSKESGLLLIPILMLVFFCGTTASWRARMAEWARLIAPYSAIAILYFFYHQHFTTPMEASQPLTAAGAHSIVALAKNGIYSIGYFFLPVDLSVGTYVLTRYPSAGLEVGTIFCIIAALLAWKYRHSDRFKMLFLPVGFTILSGIVLLLTFERWRLYLPSVGLAAIVPILVEGTARRWGKILWAVMLVPLVAFHVYGIVESAREWRASTTLLDQLKGNLSQILTEVPTRPLTIGFLDVPAKLGSASVLQLGKTAVVQRAEADRIDDVNKQTASMSGTNVGSWSAVDVYALGGAKDFRDISVTKRSSNVFVVAVPMTSESILYPASLTSNLIARRDRMFSTGDTVQSGEFLDIIRSTSDGLAKSIEVHVLDTTAILLSFSDSGFERVAY